MGNVYGPVPSRRLGRSLGVDLIPMKTCNWNCVYCQLGRTRRFTRDRREFVAARTIVDEVEATLKTHQRGAIDWITLVGSGEPTLNVEMEAIIRGIKDITDIPLAVITNGSFLSQQTVRNGMVRADAVLPSLDAGTEDLFRRINRPHRTLNLERHLDGLRRFRDAYTGELWIEVMLVAGMNDGEEALLNIAARLQEIRPDRIQISHPERPPCESWVRSTDQEGKIRALALLGRAAEVLPPTPWDYDFSGRDMRESLIEIIQRHPPHIGGRYPSTSPPGAGGDPPASQRERKGAAGVSLR